MMEWRVTRLRWNERRQKDTARQTYAGTRSATLAIRELRLIATLILMPLAGWGCGVQPDSAIHPASTVLVVGVDQLIPPAVPEPNVYQPSFVFEISPGHPERGRAWGFFVDVATAMPDRLQVRVRDRQTGIVSDLTPLPPPPDPNMLYAGADWQLEPQAEELLIGGSGVFWIAGGGASAGLVHRLAVAMPDSLAGAFSDLEAYTTTSGGAVIGAGRIELVRAFFYMAVIGDSVAWGSGLRDADKFSTLVLRAIQERTQRRVVRQVHALSGARIVPQPDDVICPVSCSAEIPTASTSIMTQVDLIQRPDLVSLVLLSGCINDVGVAAVIDPDFSPDLIGEETRLYCGQQMEALLHKLRAAVPQAVVVVTGYFPIVSPESALPEMLEYMFASGDEPAPHQESRLIELLSANAARFHETSRASLLAAVEAAGGPNSILYVDPGFHARNALFAPEPWLWGIASNTSELLTVEGQPILLPEDTLADVRAVRCFTGHLPVNALPCLYSSVGHPNIAGARAYADAILAALESLGILPAAAAASFSDAAGE